MHFVSAGAISECLGPFPLGHEYIQPNYLKSKLFKALPPINLIDKTREKGFRQSTNSTFRQEMR